MSSLRSFVEASASRREVQTSAPSQAAELSRRMRAVASGGQLPADVTAWLAEGFREYLAKRGRIKLERCLGLAASQGEWLVATRAGFAERDRWLAAAWEELAASGSAWEVAVELAKQVALFEEVHWPKWRDEGVPAGATELRVAIYRAFKASGAKVPRHWRQLRTVVQNHRASCCTEDRSPKVSLESTQGENVATQRGAEITARLNARNALKNPSSVEAPSAATAEAPRATWDRDAAIREEFGSFERYDAYVRYESTREK